MTARRRLARPDLGALLNERSGVDILLFPVKLER
jgi:hypothetical protein